MAAWSCLEPAPLEQAELETAKLQPKQPRAYKYNSLGASMLQTLQNLKELDHFSKNQHFSIKNVKINDFDDFFFFVWSLAHYWPSGAGRGWGGAGCGCLELTGGSPTTGWP